MNDSVSPARHRFRNRFLSLLKELFNNALPVFVAATISRGATSMLALTSTDLTTLIWITFAYGFFVVQAIGIAIATLMDHASDSFSYYMHVISECAGFAWKEYVALIMLKWLFVNKNVGMAAGAWMILVFCAFLCIYAFNAALALYFKPKGHVYASLRKFNSDAFALAIAFSFTLVIASEIYPVSSSGNLTNTDDIIRDPESAVEEVHGSGWYFFLYTVLVTIIMAFLQNKIGWLVDKEDNLLMEAEGSSGYRFSFDSPGKHEEMYWRSIDSVDPDTNELLENSTGSNPLNEGGILRESEFLRGSVIRPTHSTTDSDSVFSLCNSSWSYVDNIIFAWDPRGYCKQSIMHMMNTVAGYTVGCAWYTYSLLSFQVHFASINGGEILGLFIYSVFMTLAVTLIMSRIERTQGRTLQKKLKDFGRDSSVTQDVIAKFTARYKRNNELALVAGRLVCGWSWADFISSCFTSALSDRQREFTQYKSSNWLGACIKCVVAILVLLGGKFLDLYLAKRRQAKVANVEDQKLKAGSGPSLNSFRSPAMKLSAEEQGTKRHAERIFANESFSSAPRVATVTGEDGEKWVNLTSDLLPGSASESDEDEVVI